MTIKYHHKHRRMLAVLAAVGLAFMFSTPAQAADPVPPAGMGIVIVYHHVINDNGGTRLAPDFELTLKHWGANVVGSPFMGSELGTVFTVEPGTYVVTSPVTDGYLGSWSGDFNVAGFIDVQPNQVLKITRTTNDIGVAPAVVVPEPTPTTEDGGVLPSTASPWFNALLVGIVFTSAGFLTLMIMRKVEKPIRKELISH